MKDFYKIVFADATCEQQFERAFIPIGDDPNEVRHSYIWLKSADHSFWAILGFSVNGSSFIYQDYMSKGPRCPGNIVGDRGSRRLKEVMENSGLKRSSGFRTLTRISDHAELNQQLQDFLSSYTATIVEQNGEMVWMLSSQ